ncbi:type II toxin-antitoxin system VapC family toxin [Niveispirillum cyanobacteriorum]|uniref:PIN domain-containing protein n=1 Tax=Niveispirillum cyanobacteriorum TaxID=1612173 RepID=A0A2K9NAX4_9PROT|nr:type II toxin-antitoxin system VapC family toxin [Niveispirillum cyanobacteriorum]AUN30300.1 PIN domain-containing protein [Niveispirillum cyanobacteriorum]
MTIELVYWDSATFLAYFQEEQGRVQLCHGTLDRADQGEVVIITSALTIAECLWLRGERQIPKDRADIVRRFFRRSFIRVRNVSRSISEEAQTLVWDIGIKPKDAIHAATAMEAGVPIIETFDEGFIAKSGHFGQPRIIVRQPPIPTQRRLLV